MLAWAAAIRLSSLSLPAAGAAGPSAWPFTIIPSFTVFVITLLLHHYYALLHIHIITSLLRIIAM